MTGRASLRMTTGAGGGQMSASIPTTSPISPRHPQPVHPPPWRRAESNAARQGLKVRLLQHRKKRKDAKAQRTQRQSLDLALVVGSDHACGESENTAHGRKRFVIRFGGERSGGVPRVWTLCPPPPCGSIRVGGGLAPAPYSLPSSPVLSRFAISTRSCGVSARKSA